MKKETIEDIVKRVESILRENEFPFWNIDWVTDEPTRYVVHIRLEDGDWKHDHIRLRNIMWSNGFTFIDEKVEDNDGDDCYTSVHTYGWLK